MKQSKRFVTREEWQVFSNLVWDELQRAERKFPTWPNDHIHGVAIVNEESGEIVKAALQYTYQGGNASNIVKETIQTATMCLRYWIALTD